MDALDDKDPRIREQAVRMLGRDDRENGRVEYKNEAARTPPLARKNLKVLLPMAADPDAGVRRELILALRNLPTDRVGEALKTLTRTWDGRDRWYLEACSAWPWTTGRRTTSPRCSTAPSSATSTSTARGRRARSPCRPISRPIGTRRTSPSGAREEKASALSKTLGLAWRLHRAEVLPVLSRILPKLEAPELQQAADDVLGQMRDPQTAVVLADLGGKTDDPARKRQILATLARKLDSSWRDAQRRGQVVEATEAALDDPELKLQRSGSAAATEDARYADALIVRPGATTKSSPVEVRAAAIESRRPAQGREGQTLSSTA